MIKTEVMGSNPIIVYPTKVLYDGRDIRYTQGWIFFLFSGGGGRKVY